jgi:FKBP-type peptidyl-prolyl cis-trans isomerase
MGSSSYIGFGVLHEKLGKRGEKKFTENEAEIQNYITTNKIPYEKSGSGLYYRFITKNPNGAKPNLGEEISIHYRLFRMSGVTFDSTERLKNLPFVYGFGINPLIPGLDEGIASMREGERAVFLMNHYLGFGSQSDDLLPAYSAIGADVEVLKVRNEEQQIDDYVASKKLNVTEKTATGLRFVKGTTTANAQVKSGDVVSVKYTGKLLNDKVFDSGEIQVRVGTGGVIRGFEDGISKMRIGEKATLIFPSSLGYGTKGAGTNIRPYAPLLFEVEVVK